MTKYQRFAFEHPCFEVEECASDKYRGISLPWSAILTLNVGLDDASFFDGLPMCHCSVALLSATGIPVPLEHWDDDALAKCERFIRDEMFAGIGDDAREDTEFGDSAFHFRRCCSCREIEELKIRRVWPRPQDRARWN